jgi:uncharacterized protein
MTIDDRVAALPWAEIERSLWERGYAWSPGFLSAPECHGVAELYGDPAAFRSRVEMARHRFGEGEYKYFGSPLPPLVADLRAALYPPLALVANRWAEALGAPERFPGSLEGILRSCASAGQTRPTPLVLRYVEGGYNCLHQDVYGTSRSRCRPWCRSAGRASTSRAASSCWWSSVRARSPRPRS